MVKWFFLPILLILFCCGGLRKINLPLKVDANDMRGVSLEIDYGYTRKFWTPAHSREYYFIYKDSSVFYVSNNDLSGSPLNAANRFNANESLFKSGRIPASSDTLILQGVDVLGRHWKEMYFGHLVIGYLKADDEQKKSFERTIGSLKKWE